MVIINGIGHSTKLLYATSNQVSTDMADCSQVDCLDMQPATVVPL